MHIVLIHTLHAALIAARHGYWIRKVHGGYDAIRIVPPRGSPLPYVMGFPRAMHLLATGHFWVRWFDRNVWFGWTLR